MQELNKKEYQEKLYNSFWPQANILSDSFEHKPSLNLSGKQSHQASWKIKNSETTKMKNFLQLEHQNWKQNNQPINQSINQMNQSVNEWMNEWISQSVSQSINESINQWSN